MARLYVGVVSECLTHDEVDTIDIVRLQDLKSRIHYLPHGHFPSSLFQ
jgi:hypothetical protein